MTQTPLYVPAPLGWYARPGDPPNHVRAWDGRRWACEVHGPARDHFDYLRSIPPENRSPEEQALLKRLTAEVSAIEDLVLADPAGNPPLVMAPPPVPMAPADPYAGNQAYAPYGGSASYTPAFALPSRSAGPKRGSAPRRAAGALGWGIVRVLGGGVVIIALLVVKLGFWGAVSDTNTASVMAVDKCITLTDASTQRATDDLTFDKADCVTKSNSKVSYRILSKIEGEADCGKDVDSVETYDRSTDKTTFTYCLMPNLAKGECLYIDSKNFAYDVPCTDTRAVIKVTVAEDKGSGVACGPKEDPLVYPTANRSYCFGAP